MKNTHCYTTGGITITQVACGWAHTLVCSDSGDVYAWGNNAWGQLGLVQGDDTSQLSPRLVDAPELEACCVVQVDDV